MTCRSAAAFAGLVVAGSLALPTPSHAAAGPCAGRPGITVVVDPGPLGGEVRVGCARSDAATIAADAIHEAGFEITYADGQPFLCRLDGRPDAQQESCARTPPADAYWGLFWSDGQPAEWSYSTLGVAGLEIPPGGSVGLRFQDGGAREDPSLPPASPKAGTGRQPAAAAGAAPSPKASDDPDASDVPDGGQPLTWAAGGAVVALTAAALALAARRRSG